MSRAFRRAAKNFFKRYSEAEVKAREATSNDPWGPTGVQLSEISDLTYNIRALPKMMSILWKRLGEHGAKWRHVLKSLIVFDYLVKTGSEKVLQQCRSCLPTFKLLQRFEYVDKKGKDQGVLIREKATQFIEILVDEKKYKKERQTALRAKEIFSGHLKSELSSQLKRLSSFVSSDFKGTRNQTLGLAPPAFTLSDRPRVVAESLQHDSHYERRKQSTSPHLEDVVDLSRECAKSIQEISGASCNSNVLIPSRTASEKQDTENGIPNLVDDWWSPETASLAPDVLPLGTNQETVASFPASEVLKIQSTEAPNDSALRRSQASSAYTSAPYSIPNPFFALSNSSSQLNASVTDRDIKKNGATFADWQNVNPTVGFNSAGTDFNSVSSSQDNKPKRLTPEEFLGAGANLVNLDTLFEPQTSEHSSFSSTNSFTTTKQSNPSETRLAASSLPPSTVHSTRDSFLPTSPTYRTTSVAFPFMPPSSSAYSNISTSLFPTQDIKSFETPISQPNAPPTLSPAQNIKYFENPVVLQNTPPFSSSQNVQHFGALISQPNIPPPFSSSQSIKFSENPVLQNIPSLSSTQNVQHFEALISQPNTPPLLSPAQSIKYLENPVVSQNTSPLSSTQNVQHFGTLISQPNTPPILSPALSINSLESSTSFQNSPPFSPTQNVRHFGTLFSQPNTLSPLSPAQSTKRLETSASLQNTPSLSQTQNVQHFGTLISQSNTPPTLSPALGVKFFENPFLQITPSLSQTQNVQHFGTLISQPNTPPSLSPAQSIKGLETSTSLQNTPPLSPTQNTQLFRELDSQQNPVRKDKPNTNPFL